MRSATARFAGWHDIGGSSTAYSVVGIGDYNGDNVSDILFRNSATGDTGFYEIINGALQGWHDIGGSSTARQSAACARAAAPVPRAAMPPPHRRKG
jgi:hypothetical protein